MSLLFAPRHSIKVGMVGGGGPSAFFGNAHRRAISLLETHRLFAGALRSKPEEAHAAGEEWDLEQVYGNHEAMAGDAQHVGLSYITIVTPNCSHFPVAKYALQQGVPVFCEKPLTMTVEQAVELRDLARDKGIPFGVAHTYSGHYTMKVLRILVEAGIFGALRRRNAFYWQDWQRVNLGIQQEHRQDPTKSGVFNCNGDINTHNEWALRYVIGLLPTHVLCQTDVYGPDRVLDDDVNTLLWYPDGGSALSAASQIANGHENDHQIGIYGALGGADWRQEDSGHLSVSLGDFPVADVRRGGIGRLVNLLQTDAVRKLCGDGPVDHFAYLIKSIAWACGLPTGHEEAFICALAHHHHEFGRWVHDWNEGCRKPLEAKNYDVPNAQDGLEGMEFLAACKKSVDEGNVKVEIARNK
ncbi:hypothetical protein COU76_03970 [Candidatus Peregrinibacteria bacterium CG10_big_fil_rev_8_21_14_0_10_49_10]|nr:MAG: hypothetical protein COU76_03970 [Candidatus Peregrinibacteria bacterium CG10_big_fil_rev_8_21_14_0_10_49_10]